MAKAAVGDMFGAMKTLLEKMGKVRVVVVGDLVLEHFIHGETNRVSPEAPVPVVEVASDSWVPGAAANVAMNLVALGSTVELVGSLGQDPYGEKLLNLCRKAGVGCDGVCVDGARSTLRKTRVVVSHQQICRLDRDGHPAGYALGSKAREHLLHRVAEADLVILSDYAKGTLNSGLLREVRTVAKANQTFVACDPKPRNVLDFTEVDLLIPNRKESLQMVGMAVGKYETYPAEAVCEAIHARYRPRYLVVTLGPVGMLLSERNRPLRSFPTVARLVYDVSGADDTAVAVLSAALTVGAEVDAAVRLANFAAGVVVGKPGLATAAPEEILEAAAAHARHFKELDGGGEERSSGAEGSGPHEAGGGRRAGVL